MNPFSQLESQLDWSVFLRWPRPLQHHVCPAWGDHQHGRLHHCDPGSTPGYWPQGQLSEVLCWAFWRKSETGDCFCDINGFDHSGSSREAQLHLHVRQASAVFGNSPFPVLSAHIPYLLPELKTWWEGQLQGHTVLKRFPLSWSVLLYTGERQLNGLSFAV